MMMCVQTGIRLMFTVWNKRFFDLPPFPFPFLATPKTLIGCFVFSLAVCIIFAIALGS